MKAFTARMATKLAKCARFFRRGGLDLRGSATFLPLAPENGQKGVSEEGRFTEAGPGSGTFLTSTSLTDESARNDALLASSGQRVLNERKNNGKTA